MVMIWYFGLKFNAGEIMFTKNICQILLSKTGRITEKMDILA